MGSWSRDLVNPENWVNTVAAEDLAMQGIVSMRDKQINLFHEELFQLVCLSRCRKNANICKYILYDIYHIIFLNLFLNMIQCEKSQFWQNQNNTVRQWTAPFRFNGPYMFNYVDYSKI